ncbi:hypothetical protein BWQ96_09326 [Gracilariopsis chorda]|uniref:Uncharacterized protein n=1 Tax=Gracilariopsis chorda TaxID=448386 RepID=A0A2V3IFU8_9FLOR|nr:hypothetical protein BWQ96_09326 [Gracilariopsis chorda]|eukprot:PXF40931.1 hypothetical protein BWQ96_09326 [Gracilariopsis chorda]
MLASPTSHKLRQSVVEAVVTRLSSLRIFVKASHSSYISCLDMFSRFISQVSDWTRGSTAEEPPASPSNTSNDSSNQLNSIRSTPSRTRSGHARQRSGNFSEVEFMDSGLGRSLTADLPVLGLQDELDALQFDDLFVEEYLLSRLQDAQRRLQEVREYMATLTEEELVSANRPPLPPNSSPNVSPIPGHRQFLQSAPDVRKGCL